MDVGRTMDELHDVGIDNTSNVLDVFEKFSSVEEFMHDDLYVAAPHLSPTFQSTFTEATLQHDEET